MAEASANGTEVRRQKPPEGEVGSSIDDERLFLSFDDGDVFTPQDTDARRIDEMLRVDGKAKTLEQVLTLPLRSVDFTIEPAEGDRGEAEFIREALLTPANAGGMSTPMELVVAQATGACLYRRAHFEKVYRAVEGRVLFDKVAFRPPATCRLKLDKQTGGFRGFKQRVPTDHPGRDDQGEVTIKPQLAFVFTHGQHRRPIEGVSDLETAYALWEAKQKVKFLWFTFLENQTMPKAVAKHGENDPASIQRFARKVATLKGGGVVGIGPDQDVSAFESSGRGASEFQEAVRYLDGEMSNSVLAGFTDLTSGAAAGRGSFALSKDSTDLFLQSRQAVLRELGAAIVNFLIADLVRWNFGRAAAVPRFKFGPLVPEHAEVAVEMLKELTGQATPNPLFPVEFLEMLVEKVAGYLDLDVDRVMKAIRDRTEGAQSPADELRGGLDAAEQLVAEAGLAQRAAA